jgi:hypothetical protein
LRSGPQVFLGFGITGWSRCWGSRPPSHRRSAGLLGRSWLLEYDDQRERVESSASIVEMRVRDFKESRPDTAELGGLVENRDRNLNESRSDSTELGDSVDFWWDPAGLGDSADVELDFVLDFADVECPFADVK